jgi:isoleucyl-tRNA synthetase
MRFYLMNSPVTEAQDFRFAEAGVEEVVKKVILPLWNTYYFFTTYANIDNFKPNGLPNKLENNLDKWLLSELNTLTKEVTTGFEEYKLGDAAKPIVKFMDNLTNWYIRRSRKRFWKSESDTDKNQAYETLTYILVETTKIIAPFMPFISEHMYKNLTGSTSVHLTDFPTYNADMIDEKLNADTLKVQQIITLGLAWRANNKFRVRQPLNSITVTEEFDNYYIEILKEELNVKQVLVVDGNTLAKQVCKPNGRAIGPKFGKDVKFIISEAKAGNFELLDNGDVRVGHFELQPTDFELVFEA